MRPEQEAIASLRQALERAGVPTSGVSGDTVVRRVLEMAGTSGTPGDAIDVVGDLPADRLKALRSEFTRMRWALRGR